jgi:cytochrome c biogenesis protein CcmG/thiol:disulfide interchange protein DsbE
MGLVGADRSGRVGIDWGVYGVPETYVIDKDGRIAYRHVGPLQAQDLDRTILPLLEQLK